MHRTIIILMLILPVCLFGQDYDRAAVVRLGSTSGLTYKKFIVEREAIEMIVSGRNDGTQFTALYEFHKPMEVAFEDENFHFYYGISINRKEDRS